jgi:hypothetical protein
LFKKLLFIIFRFSVLVIQSVAIAALREGDWVLDQKSDGREPPVIRLSNVLLLLKIEFFIFLLE